MLQISKRDFAPLALTMLGVVALVLLMVSTAFADGPRPNRNDVVVGAPAGYVYNAEWVTGVSQDGGAKGQSIKLATSTADNFAFYAFTGWWDQNLSDVTKIRASFKPAAGTVNSGGSPRISLEVDLNGDGSVADDYTVIYLDPAHCGDLLASGWTQSDFTGDLTNCSIYTSLSATPYTSDGVTSAWDMLVADPIFADAKVWFAYLIQDASVGANYVDRIMLDSAFLTKQP